MSQLQTLGGCFKSRPVEGQAWRIGRGSSGRGSLPIPTTIPPPAAMTAFTSLRTISCA